MPLNRVQKTRAPQGFRRDCSSFSPALAFLQCRFDSPQPPPRIYRHQVPQPCSANRPTSRKSLPRKSITCVNLCHQTAKPGLGQGDLSRKAGNVTEQTPTWFTSPKDWSNAGSRLQGRRIGSEQSPFLRCVTPELLTLSTPHSSPS